MASSLNKDELFFSDEWVEISDGEGHKAALRHLATIRCAEQTYDVLGAVREDMDGQGALMLVRRDMTVDGVMEHVLVSDEHEIEQVVGQFVMHMLMEHLDDADDAPQDDTPDPCGCRHQPGEFCYCDDPAYLQ